MPLFSHQFVTSVAHCYWKSSVNTTFLQKRAIRESNFNNYFIESLLVKSFLAISCSISSAPSVDLYIILEIRRLIVLFFGYLFWVIQFFLWRTNCLVFTNQLIACRFLQDFRLFTFHRFLGIKLPWSPRKKLLGNSKQYFCVYSSFSVTIVTNFRVSRQTYGNCR